jgi:hypothetical protein
MVTKVGDVFMYSGTGPDDAFGAQKPHRCVVVKVDSDNNIYLVPVCSVTPPYIYDKTCELDPSAPALRLSHKSYVAYWGAKKVPHNANFGKCIGILPLSLLSTIVDGIAKSRDTPPWFRDAINPPAPRRILRSE